MAFRKADITTHHFHNDGYAPCINVKVYNFGRDETGKDGQDRLMADYGMTEKRAEHLMEIAYEWLQRDFWERATEDAQETLTGAFGRLGRELMAYGDGRSGGWLRVGFQAVDGRQGPANDLDDLESWDAPKVSAWGRFEAQIKAELEYFTSYAAVVESLEPNDLLSPDAERLEAKRKAEAIVEPFGYKVVEAESN